METKKLKLVGGVLLVLFLSILTVFIFFNGNLKRKSKVQDESNTQFNKNSKGYSLQG